MTHTLKYKPAGETLRQLLRKDSEGPFKDSWPFMRAIRGPVGSGKSAACCIGLFLVALNQAPGPDGIRRTRFAIIRNSYPELRTTTLNTWRDWFPETVWGHIRMHPPPYTHVLKKGDLEIEVLFLALDRPEDVKKLLSLELTAAWINEAREVPKTIVDAVTMRVGRYPSRNNGGATWYGVLMDTNAPDEDHWWPIMAGEAPIPDHFSREDALLLVRPDSWRFLNQPGGMLEVKDQHGDLTGYRLNPDAENRKNLPPNYYPDIIKGKARDWISVYVLNRLGSLSDGKSVYPDFDRALHVAREPLLPVPGVPIHVGVDFGLTPAAVFGQQIRGRWLILGELVATDMGVVRFGPLLKQELANRFPGHRVIVTGDPAGDYRAQTDETTPFQVLRSAGITARPAGTNDVSLRIGVVEQVLCRLVDRQPGLLIDPGAVTLIRGFEGGYHYRRLQVSGAERFENTPNKNKFSHVHDASQYMFLGGGESRALTVGGLKANVRNARAERHDPFARKRKGRA